MPGYSAMTVNTAICFLLTALVMWFADAGTAVVRRVKLAATTVVLTFSGLTLLQYVSGSDLGIDQLLWSASADRTAPFPGRMAPNSAVAFLLLHTALFLLVPGQGARRAVLAVALCAAVALIGAYETVGYLALMTTGYGWGEHTSMSLHAGVLFLLLGGVCAANAWRAIGLKWSLWGGTMAGFALSVALLLMLAIYSFASLWKFRDAADWVRRTHEIQAALAAWSMYSSVEGELAMRDYALTGEEDLVAQMQARLAEALRRRWIARSG